MSQIEGNNANADDAIMLDKDGYVSETNATNIVRHASAFHCPDFSIHEEVFNCCLTIHMEAL